MKILKNTLNHKLNAIEALVLAFFLMGSLAINAQDTSHKVPKYVVIDSQFLEFSLKSTNPKLISSKKRFIKKADSLLNMKPLSVVNKTMNPPSGDKHDYISISIYRWPDTTKVDGLPWIKRDGQANKKVIAATDQKKHRQMMQAIAELALAYHITKKDRYAEKSIELIHHWFINEETKMNPNLNYSQSIPGENDGSFWGIIDGVLFVWVIDALKLIEPSGLLTNESTEALNNWYTAFSVWLQNSEFGKKEAAMENNHGSFYDMQLSSISFFLDKPKQAYEILKQVSRKRMQENQITENGLQPEELKRTRSFHYSIFNLQALLTLARHAKSLGVNIHHFPNNKQPKLKKAITFLKPYAIKKENWPYKDIKFNADEFFVVLSNTFSVYPSLQKDFDTMLTKSKSIDFTELFFKH